MGLKIFVDFDGTITRQDVGDSLFFRFGGEKCRELVNKCLGGEVSAVECFRGETEAMGRFNVADLDAFIDEQEIDETFRTFVGYCGAKGFPLMVLSDGFDYYIRRILRRHELPDVPFLSNVFSLVDRGENGTARARVSFPQHNEECTCCASCKRNMMLTTCAESDVICYIGEGYSDRCPVRYADIVFAKDALQFHCQRENISYYPYRSFDDILGRLRELTARPHLRHRRRAELNRRKAFSEEA